jgi:hypothetical protein
MRYFWTFSMYRITFTPSPMAVVRAGGEARGTSGRDYLRI